jgi:hypothetical protein
MMNEFTCAKCNETFIKKRSDKESMDEFKDSPRYVPGDEVALLCDDCFNEFQQWLSELTPEDHKRIRNE